MKTNEYLKEKIELPDVVLKMEEDTFARIRQSCAGTENEKKGLYNKKTASKSSDAAERTTTSFRIFRKKPVLAIAVVMLIVLGCGSALAAVLGHWWSRGLDASIEATKDQRISLEERGFVKNLDMDPVTIGDVSVTPVAAITDGTVGYISLEISGYELEEGGIPFFDSKGEFYVLSDTEADYLADMNTEGLHFISGGSQMTGFYRESTDTGYADENGNLEYIAEIVYTDGSLFGETVRFEMENLGTLLCADNSETPNYRANVINGTWTFDVTFQEESTADISRRELELDTAIADTECVLEKVTIADLSIIMDYTIPEAGGCLTLEQIILSDGEVLDLNYPYYKSRTAPEEVSETITALGRVVDINEIEAIVVHYNLSLTGEYILETIKLSDTEVVTDDLEKSDTEVVTDVLEKSTEESEAWTLTSENVKLVDLENQNFNGKMMLISDPSQVFLGTIQEYSEGDGEAVYTIMSDYEGTVGGINAGSIAEAGQNSCTAMPYGYVISEGTVKLGSAADTDEKYHVVGFTSDNQLFMGELSANEAIERNLRDAVCTDPIYGPFLLVDGEVSDEIPGETDFGGAPTARTVIGQKKDGTVILLVIDGRQSDTPGATYAEVIELLQANDIYNACAMTGGSSSQMVYDGQLQNHPYTGTPRCVPTAWLVREG